MIVVVDFGSQTAHLIGRRLRQLGVDVSFVTPEESLVFINTHQPRGIILSGGPSSVYDKGSPTVPKKYLNWVFQFWEFVTAGN